MRFNNAKIGTAPQIVCFTAENVRLLRDNHFVVMIVHFVSFSQAGGVKLLADIAANLPRVFPAGNSTMLVSAGRFRSQGLFRVVADIPADINLYFRKVRLLNVDGITAASCTNI